MSINNWLKLSLITASSVALIACGSGNTPAGKEVSGKAVKGVIANGKVELFGLVGGVEQLLDSTTTDANGDYSLDVPDTYSGPVKLVVTAVSGTTMMCDAPAGCGDVAFGQAMPLNEGTSLKAVMRNVEPNQPVNIHVTPITNMAVAHVEANGGLSSNAVIAANEKVANLFKLPGNFVSLEPVDVTNADSVRQAADSAVNYGVLAGAFAGGSAEDLDDRLNAYANAFAADQLLENSSDSNVPSVKAIFQPASDLAAHINSGAIEAQFDSLIAGLVEDVVSTVPTSGGSNSELDTMVQAALDDVTRLSTTLNQQTLQTYVQSQIDQLSWIITPELIKTVMSSVNVIKEVMFVALAHDQLAASAVNGVVDRSAFSGGADNVEVTYTIATNTLRFKTKPGKTVSDHEIDFEIVVTPIHNGVLTGELPYVLKSGATISNAKFSTVFNKDSNIRFIFDQNDDFSDVQKLLNMLYVLLALGQNPNADPLQIQALQLQLVAAIQTLPPTCGALMQQNDLIGMIDCVVGDFVTGLDASGYLEFGMLVSKVGDATQQFDIDFKGFADINFTDPNAATVARLEIQDGHLYTPNGDRLFTVDGAKGLVLDLGNTDNTMFARFGIDSVLIPETHVTLRGTFHDLQDYLDLFNQTPLDFDFNELQLSNVFQKPFATGSKFLAAVLKEGAIVDTLNYLVGNTTPKDYIRTLTMGLEVQEDALWQPRRYDVEFINNVLHLTNQDGIKFAYTAEQGAIVSVISAFGNDLITVRVTEEGVTVTDIDDQITIDVNNLPVDEMMNLYARLGILIDLDDKAQALLDSYAGSAPSININQIIGN